MYKMSPYKMSMCQMVDVVKYQTLCNESDLTRVIESIGYHLAGCQAGPILNLESSGLFFLVIIVL
jgi:hypothetical protein